jgi:hypothetical protein
MNNDVEIVGDEPEACEVKDEDILSINRFFATEVYSIAKPKFLQDATEVFERHIKKTKKERPKKNKLYPVTMTENLQIENKLSDMMYYILHTTNNILISQGYNTELYNISLSEFWGQEHDMYSGHEEHVHTHGTQITGFYFLDVPDESSRVVIHDPRFGKRIIDLVETDVENVTLASNVINFQPKKGEFMFLNGWLPHSFTRHGNKKPLKFIHFNVNCRFKNSA